MNNNQLPRIDNNPTVKSTLEGGLKMFSGVSLTLASAFLWIMQGTLGRFFDTSSMAFIRWPLLALAVWLICSGYEDIGLAKAYNKLSISLSHGNTNIDHLAQFMGETPEKTTNLLSKMFQKRYFSRVDVEDNFIRVFLDKIVTQYSRYSDITPAEGMRFITKQESTEPYQPFVATVLIGLAVLLPLPLSNAIWVILALILSFPVKKILGLMMPKKKFVVYEQVPKFAPEKIKMELSGDERADEMIEAATTYLVSLQDLDQKIKDPELKKEMFEISVGLTQLIKEIKQSPEKFRQVQQTIDYSIPTAIKLYYKYVELDAYPVKGENITKSMNKIHEMSDMITKTFKKELDSLYQDQSLNIEVDVDVMRSMLQQESINLTSMLDDIEKKERVKL